MDWEGWREQLSPVRGQLKVISGEEPPGAMGKLVLGGSRNTDTTYFDDILIRYITNPEPSTFLHPEES